MPICRRGLLTLILILFACGDDSAQGEATDASREPATSTAGENERDGGGQDPSSADAGDLNDAGSMANVRGDGGTFPGPDAMAAVASYMTVCEQTCTMQSECVGVTTPECVEQCTAQARGLASQNCVEEGLAELECLRTLSCDELRAYGTEGRRDHPICGAPAATYFANCTVGRGEVPTGCRKWCERNRDCQLLSGSFSACEESCILQATSAAWHISVECSEAFLNVADCIGDVSCAEAAALRSVGMVPAACESLDRDRDQICF